MSKWQDYVTGLADTFDHLRSPDDTPGEPPIIATPIDKGARELLLPHSRSWADYPVLEVEYLMRTLNEHLQRCVEVRERAQELEARAISETMEKQVQLMLLQTMAQQVDLASANEPALLSNTRGARLENNAVRGESSDYWTKLAALQKRQLGEQEKHARLQLEQMKEPGSGANYLARFTGLKEAFDVDLREAYLRARAAAVGLKHVYGLELPVPALADVGYLDRLVLWARDATYRFEKRLFGTHEALMGFALQTGTAAAPLDLPKIFIDTDFKTSRAAHIFTFQLQESFFGRLGVRMRNPRLRGVDLNVYAPADGTALAHRYWRARLDLPKQVIRGGADEATEKSPQVLLPIVTYPAVRSTLSDYPSQRAVHNTSPFGEWSVRLEPNDWVTGTVTNGDAVVNVILRLRLAYEQD